MECLNTRCMKYTVHGPRFNYPVWERQIRLPNRNPNRGHLLNLVPLDEPHWPR